MFFILKFLTNLLELYLFKGYFQTNVVLGYFEIKKQEQTLELDGICVFPQGKGFFASQAPPTPPSCQGAFPCQQSAHQAVFTLNVMVSSSFQVRGWSLRQQPLHDKKPLYFLLVAWESDMALAAQQSKFIHSPDLGLVPVIMSFPKPLKTCEKSAKNCQSQQLLETR